MGSKHWGRGFKRWAAAALLWQGLGGGAVAAESCMIVTADRVFDGYDLLMDTAVLTKDGKVAQVGAFNSLKSQCAKRIRLGDATLLPGIIESHAHLTYQNVDPLVVLKHGVTTVRDVGGPLLPPQGGDGALRLVSAGPIIQAPGGYPLNIFGGTGGLDKIGIEVASTKQARTVVRQLVAGGVAVIKIALEPGGEPGAPWMNDHGGGVPATPWPVLDVATVRAITSEAHRLGKRVTAHVGEAAGLRTAIDGGVDELAHIPCAAIDETTLHDAVHADMRFVTTLDTLSSCAGIFANAHTLTHAMEEHGLYDRYIYGSEIGHDNVPWGANGEEMHLMLHLTSGDGIDFADVLNVFKAATSRAGENLGIAKLGTLTPDAPADMIAVRGNAFERFKILEYPDLVISGGTVVVNNFKK